MFFSKKCGNIVVTIQYCLHCSTWYLESYFQPLMRPFEFPLHVPYKSYSYSIECQKFKQKINIKKTIKCFLVIVVGMCILHNYVSCRLLFRLSSSLRWWWNHPPWEKRTKLQQTRQTQQDKLKAKTNNPLFTNSQLSGTYSGEFSLSQFWVNW